MRDFTLKLEEDGRAISARQYLEGALADQRAHGADAHREPSPASPHFILPRARLRDAARPAADEAVLRELGAVPAGDARLRPAFETGLAELRDRLEATAGAQPKSMYGALLEGPMLATLLASFLDSINTGGAAVVSTAWQQLLQLQRKEAEAGALRGTMKRLPHASVVEMVRPCRTCRRRPAPAPARVLTPSTCASRPVLAPTQMPTLTVMQMSTLMPTPHCPAVQPPRPPVPVKRPRHLQLPLDEPQLRRVHIECAAPRARARAQIGALGGTDGGGREVAADDDDEHTDGIGDLGAQGLGAQLEGRWAMLQARNRSDSVASATALAAAMSRDLQQRMQAQAEAVAKQTQEYMAGRVDGAPWTSERARAARSLLMQMPLPALAWAGRALELGAQVLADGLQGMGQRFAEQPLGPAKWDVFAVAALASQLPSQQRCRLKARTRRVRRHQN